MTHEKESQIFFNVVRDQARGSFFSIIMLILNFESQVFKDGRLSHFVDGRGSAGNWMSYVNCARSAAEQNLVAIQDGDAIFYEVNKS